MNLGFAWERFGFTLPQPRRYVGVGAGFTPLRLDIPSLQGGRKGRILECYWKFWSSARVVTGFTIIELLVVVAVITLIASVALAMFSTARARGRDARREQDAKTLQSALSLYAVNARIYPTADPAVCLDGSDAVSQALIDAGALSVVPRDPQHTCPGNPDSDFPSAPTSYYRYFSADGTDYEIHFYLETDSTGNGPGLQQTAP